MLGEMPTTRTKLQVVKIAAGGKMRISVVSEKPVTCHVHWIGDRSYMCPGIDCQACFGGVGARWHGFLAVRWEVQGRRIAPLGLLELTESSYERLMGICKMFDLPHLFGLQVELTRRSKKSMIRAEPTEGQDDDVLVRTPFPHWMLMDAVATLYSLPPCQNDGEVSSWESKAIPRAATLVKLAVKRLLGGHSPD